jgi:hypothetical protein
MTDTQLIAWLVAILVVYVVVAPKGNHTFRS